MLPSATIEELLERMTELHGDENWQVRITANRVVVEWDWEDDGDLENEIPGEGCSFTASLRYVTGTTLRHALEIATREWCAIEPYGGGSQWGWCCRLCLKEHTPTLATKTLAEVQGAKHLLYCAGRSGEALAS